MKTTRFLLEYNGRGAFVDMLPDDHSRYYGEVQEAFLDLVGGKDDRFASVAMRRWTGADHVCGVRYTWELANSNGAAFELLQMPDTDPSLIKQAKDMLRRQRDVVSMRVRRVTELIEFTPPPRMQEVTL